jgi:hypothetical protein
VLIPTISNGSPLRLVILFNRLETLNALKLALPLISACLSTITRSALGKPVAAPAQLPRKSQTPIATVVLLGAEMRLIGTELAVVQHLRRIPTVQRIRGFRRGDIKLRGSVGIDKPEW